MNFSSIDTNALTPLYNNMEKEYKNIKQNRKDFRNDMMNQIEVFMQSKFGKSIKVTMLSSDFDDSYVIEFSFDNSYNSSLTIDFNKDEETGKFEAKINNSFTYVDFDLTTDNKQNTIKINLIYSLVNNIDGVKDIFVGKLKEIYSTYKRFNDKSREYMHNLVELDQEIKNRKLIDSDDEIWNTIKNDEKLQKKYVIVSHTTRNTNVMLNGKSRVHLYSVPKTKTALKKERYLNDDEEIVKVSELSMLLH